MKIILNQDGFVTSYALIGGFGNDAIEVAEPLDISDFKKNYRSYYLSSDNVLLKNNDKQTELEETEALNMLRSQRAKICFPYINRGVLWYDKMSVEQKEELNAWYQAWLDVTETRVIPETPEWLN